MRMSSCTLKGKVALPGSDSFAGEVAECRESHVVCAIPGFGHRSKTFSFAVTLEAEPSAFQLWYAGEVSRQWGPPIGNGSAWRLRSTSSPAIRNCSPLYFPTLGKLRIRLPNFPPATQIIFENPDSHVRFRGRISCQKAIERWSGGAIDRSPAPSLYRVKL